MQYSLIRFVCVYRSACKGWCVSGFIKVYFLVKYIYSAKYTNRKWGTQWIFTVNIYLCRYHVDQEKDVSIAQKLPLSFYQSYFVFYLSVFSSDFYHHKIFLPPSEFYMHGIRYYILFYSCSCTCLWHMNVFIFWVCSRGISKL